MMEMMNAMAMKARDICERFCKEVHAHGFQKMARVGKLEIGVNFENSNDKEHAKAWIGDAVRHLDLYNAHVPLYFCAGSMGSVWLDVYLAGPKLNDPSTLVLKRTRVAVYEDPNKPGCWKVLLDATFEEDWLAKEVRLVDTNEPELLARLVKDKFVELAQSANPDEMECRKVAYDQVYESCYLHGARQAKKAKKEASKKKASAVADAADA